MAAHLKTTQESSVEIWDAPDFAEKPGPTARAVAEWLETAKAEARAEGYAEGQAAGFEAGRASGYAAGMQQGAEAAAADRELVNQQLSTCLSSLAGAGDAAASYWQAHLTALSLALAARILRVKLADSTVLARLAQEALQQVPPAARQVTLQLHPDDLQRLQSLSLPWTAQVHWEPDAGMTPGGLRVLVDWADQPAPQWAWLRPEQRSTAWIDATVESRWEEAMQSLAEDLQEATDVSV